jgi:hypothetical protein
MTKQINFKYIETVRYTDGTPPLVTASEGAIVREPLPANETDKECVKQWVRDNMWSGESRIQDFLFRYRKDPKHKRSKYDSVTYEVTDAWIVEYP